MGRRLQFGSGQNLLPPPWENYDSETDISKPLPFDNGSASFILAEHVIEHVDFESGVRFLFECRRVLESRGTLRLAFPDITREVSPAAYQKVASHVRSFEDIWLETARSYGHKCLWTWDIAWRMLRAVGFRTIANSNYANSNIPELCFVDGHHKLVGLELAAAETTVIEAIK
jgi:Methyltransferase domain